MADRSIDGTGRKRGVNETSVWRKEIAFAAPPPAAEPLAVAGPTVETAPVEAPAVEASPVEAIAPELVLPAPVEPAPEPVASVPVAAEPVVSEPLIPEPVVAEPLVAEPVAPDPVTEPVSPAAEAVVEAKPETVAEPEPAIAPEPVVAAAPPTQVAEVVPPEAPPVQLPAAALPTMELPVELPPADSGGAYSWLTDGLESPHATEPRAREPEPNSVPEPEPEPVSDEKVPFWKKDVSLSRAPKADRPKKPPKEKRERKPKADRPPKKRARKDAKPAVEPTVEQPPRETSTPFWKRDLSLGKKRAKPEQAPKAAKPSNATKAAKAPKQKSPPFWKKDFSLKRSPSLAKAVPIERAASERRKGKKKDVVIGLKIGASQLAAARVVNNGSPELVQVAREPLADGIIVGGELRDPETLASELSAFFARHKLPKRNVRLGIANNRIGVRTFEISGIDDPRQLANAIRFRAQETLPIPLEDAVLDWQVLSETQDDETGVTRRVVLVVVYRELVDRYVAACKKAGIRLSGIDLEAFAMLRAVIPPPPPGESGADGVSVVVNVGHDRSTLAVSDGRICEFTRVLSWGGQSLSIAIARSLDQTPSEIEPLKHALVFGGAATAPDGFSQENADAAAEAASRELQAFARELVSSLRFYQNQPGSLGIGEIVLTGGTSHMPGLAAEVERLIGVTVRVGDPLSRVKLGKRFKDPEQIGSFAVAVGLGIDD